MLSALHRNLSGKLALTPFVLALTIAGIGTTAVSDAAPLPQCGEDGLEDNDSCGTALPIAAPFSAANLVVYKTDTDYYSVTVPAGQELNVDIFFTHFTADIDLFLYDLGGVCGGLFTFLDKSDSSSNDESASWLNTGTTSVDVAIKVLVFPGSLAVCNTYDMQMTVSAPFDPCDPNVSDDTYEDNDICAAAFPISFGLIQDLWVSRSDDDFYSVTLQPGQALDVQIFFLDAQGDLDLFLYDAGGPCGDGAGSGELASGFTQTDDERIIWYNTGSTPRNLIIHVDVFATGNCNTYDLSATTAGGGVGTNYCNANANSTGVIGLISAAGTSSRAANDLRLSALQLPPNSFGFFLNSETMGFVPNAGGGQGNLCVSGSVGRFDAMIQNTGGGGSMAITVDLGALPQPNGAVSATAGQTWHFQAWHRDSAGGSTTSNLTNAIRVLLTN